MCLTDTQNLSTPLEKLIETISSLAQLMARLEYGKLNMQGQVFVCSNQLHMNSLPSLSLF